VGVGVGIDVDSGGEVGNGLGVGVVAGGGVTAGLGGGVCGNVCFGVEMQLTAKRRISTDVPISDSFFIEGSILT